MAATAGATRIRFGYSLGSLVTGAFGTVPGLLLLPYLTDTLGIAAGAAGLLVLLPKAWDVVVNPVAGRMSDRYRSPLGPRRPFLLAVAWRSPCCSRPSSPVLYPTVRRPPAT